MALSSIFMQFESGIADIAGYVSDLMRAGAVFILHYYKTDGIFCILTCFLNIIKDSKECIHAMNWFAFFFLRELLETVFLVMINGFPHQSAIYAMRFMNIWSMKKLARKGGKKTTP